MRKKPFALGFRRSEGDAYASSITARSFQFRLHAPDGAYAVWNVSKVNCRMHTCRLRVHQSTWRRHVLQFGNVNTFVPDVSSVGCYRRRRPQDAPTSSRGVVWRQRHGGLFRISAVDCSSFAVGHHHRFQRPYCSVSRNGRSWDRSFFYCTQPIACSI